MYFSCLSQYSVEVFHGSGGEPKCKQDIKPLEHLALLVGEEWRSYDGLCSSYPQTVQGWGGGRGVREHNQQAQFKEYFAIFNLDWDWYIVNEVYSQLLF